MILCLRSSPVDKLRELREHRGKEIAREWSREYLRWHRGGKSNIWGLLLRSLDTVIVRVGFVIVAGFEGSRLLLLLPHVVVLLHPLCERKLSASPRIESGWVKSTVLLRVWMSIRWERAMNDAESADVREETPFWAVLEMFLGYLTCR